MAPDRVETLRRDLLQRLQDAETPLDDDDFDRFAHRVFARNFDAIPAYAAYCRARGRTPADVDRWTDIPAVPTAAFKELTLRAGDRPTERIFRTSGTTRGAERRGEHHVADLDLYRASLRSTFRACVLPDDAALPCLSLMPAAADLPDSSLAFMISDILDHFGAAGSAVFATRQGVDYDALDAAVREAEGENLPVLLLGTTAAFIHWLDHLGRAHTRWELPPGSRLVDTGGYKGRGQRIEPHTLAGLYHDHFGLQRHECINEYGMTELLSQHYDGDFRALHRDRPGPARKQGPPWLRAAAVDPETLEPVPNGEPGVLRFLDLANLDSVAAVQTEDFGCVDEAGVTLEGRAADAPPRGCSLAMDLLLGGDR